MSKPTICVGFGGKGANQAVAAAQLGAHVEMIGKVGADSFGKDMLDNFVTRGISVDNIITSSMASTGVASISVADDGSNTIVIVGGTNDLLSAQEVFDRQDCIKRSKVLLVQLEIDVQTTFAALKLARQLGVTTILNTAPAQTLSDEIYQYADFVSPNETELEALTGRTVSSTDDAVEAARDLIKRGATHVVVTLGEKGSLLVTALSSTFVPVEDKVSAIDTTGAGDCFLGSFAFFLAQGVPITECMRRANKAAGISVTRLGTQTSFPARLELPHEWFTNV